MDRPTRRTHPALAPTEAIAEPEPLSERDPLARVGALLRIPTPPGSLPDEAVEALEGVLWRRTSWSGAGVLATHAAALTLFYYYADRGEWPEATRVLARVANAAPVPETGLRSALVDLTQAFHLAHRGQNPAGARDFLWLARQEASAAEQPALAAALAAILLAEGDAAQALACARTARRHLAEAPLPAGATQALTDWLDEIAARAEASAVPAEQPVRAAPARSPVTRPAIGQPPAGTAWDPGVPSERRAGWLWRNPHTADLIA